MRPIVTFTVAPLFPKELERLSDLYKNLYWTWNPVIRECLRSIAPEIWHAVNHHPATMLEQLPAGRLEELANDSAFMVKYAAALATLDGYLGSEGWYQKKRGGNDEVIAYLSAEFGLHESVPLYSGGLGVLSGDHTKSASDLAIPIVCVGLMYQMGYFRQRLAIDGAQLENYDLNTPSSIPLIEMTGADGKPLRIVIDFPRGPVAVRVWRLDVGRVPIYLLDTNIAENTIPEYRDIADYLYGGDLETRIMQEILLGIGGMRTLLALGIDPTVTHSNEGHSAFLMLERSRVLMHRFGLSFIEASELTAAGSVFTTHTPVPAGNDVFPVEMIEKYFGSYWPQLGLEREEFLSLGRLDPANSTEGFSMTILALKLTSKRNGVSQLHARVSREMWSTIWSNVPKSEAPITGITNGVHTPTWLADQMGELFDRHLPPNWRSEVSEREIWEHAGSIPDADLWRTKNLLRADLISYVHQRLDEGQAEWYTRSEQGRDPEGILDPSILTIGFARRFATYKRATLLFRDPARALRLFADPDRPIQFVIAGKAHPKDIPGKEFIKKVIGFIREQRLESRIVFVEDYDIAVGRRMTQGCDIWLNTPRRPQEASGTSGMKAAVNGTLNLSILDGWFPEGYDATNGFAIGQGEEFADPEHQDEFESRKLYRILEEHVLPLFYTRNAEGIPEGWVAMQKRALQTLAGRFSADRMVKEYAERFYFPASDRYRHLAADGAARVRDLVNWKRNVLGHWEKVKFADIKIEADPVMRVDQQVTVTARLSLSPLSPNDLRVEAYMGEVDAEGMVSQGTPLQLGFLSMEDGMAIYQGTIPLRRPGHAGVTVRAVPWNPELNDFTEMNRVVWY